jgi:predicted RNA-binding protein associated with RNAse of E/G family
VYYQGQEVLGSGYRAVWFLFQGEPYDVARCYRPHGTWTGYYVDILEPVHWIPGDPPKLEPLEDLFLDLWIAPDGGYLVVDRDELEDAAGRGYLTARQYEGAQATLSRLIEGATSGTFPPALARGYSDPTMQV